MTLVIRKFVCRRCKNSASIDNLTNFMSVVECVECDVAEVLSHENVGTLDHFSYLDIPYSEKWMN